MKVEHVLRPGYGPALVIVVLGAVAAWLTLVVLGDLRLLLTLGAFLLLLQLCLVRPQAALLLMLTWLPLSGLVRRVLDYPTRGPDPLLSMVPAVTGVMMIVAWWTHRGTLGRSLRESTPTKLVALLVVILILAMFNPIQGSVLTGLGGAVFLFFPVLWYFLGRTYFNDALITRLYRLVMVIGFGSALYGMYQALVGFSRFELDWIAAREFGALWIEGFVRPFSTFPNPEEWSYYMVVAAVIAVGFLVTGSSRSIWAVAVTVACSAGLFFAGVRTSVFGYLVAMAVLFTMTARSRPSATVRLVGIAAALAAYVWLTPAPSRAEVYASRTAWETFFGHTVRGVSAPLSEESLLVRFDLWWKLFTDVIPHYPLGMGLGVPTLGAWKFDPSAQIGTESYAVAMFVATGILGGFLLLGILGMMAWHAARLCRRRPDPTVQIASALLALVVFTSIFGNSLSLYTIGPIGWALMGWLSAQPVRRP